MYDKITIVEYVRAFRFFLIHFRFLHL